MELSIASDEQIRFEGVAAIARGQFGGRWGPLLLTTKRLVWYETGPVWPLKRQTREVDLNDITQVDEGSFLDRIFGGRRIRIHLRNGKTMKFFEGQGKLHAWISEVRRATTR